VRSKHSTDFDKHYTDGGIIPKELDFDLRTDSHLSKDFNKVLQMGMFACNQTGYIAEATPHFDYLQAYHASVNSFFKNTFFLFDTIKYKDRNLTEALMDKMESIKKHIMMMRYYPQYQCREAYDIAMEECNTAHMMIMYGLQKRNMLVRMSESEPRGVDAIQYWDKKILFSKGDIKVRKLENKMVV
jgi:hypothetical protein